MEKYTPEIFLEKVNEQLTGEGVNIDQAEPAREIAKLWASKYRMDFMDTVKLAKDFVAFARVYHNYKTNRK